MFESAETIFELAQTIFLQVLSISKSIEKIKKLKKLKEFKNVLNDAKLMQ